MDLQLLERIDEEIRLCRKELAKDTIDLIAIKSVKGEPLPGAPFGTGPRQMLNKVLEMGKNAGMCGTEYTDSFVGLSLQEGTPDLGIWIHGDVVPEGTGWNFDPYKAVEHKGYIIGRGATDNKGQFCAVFHLFKIFKKLGIQLNYLPAIYVGSDEESGAYDIKDFLAKYQPPKMSLVPDSGFPAGYGGKGKINVCFRPKKKLQGLTMAAGMKEDSGKAVAKLGQRTLETSTPPAHTSVAQTGGNMITHLMEKLLEEGEVSPEDRPVLEFFHLLSSQPKGEAFGFDVQSETMTTTVMTAIKIEMVDGVPEMLVTIRNPIELDGEKIVQKLRETAEAYAVELTRAEVITKPYLLDRSWPVLKKLEEVAEEITQDGGKPYTVGGYTYAHFLPNAVVYGTDANVIPEDFPEGHGGAHGKDESASIDRLQRAMRIYARALLALNEMDWCIE